MNNKKAFISGLFCILCVLPCFSERKTRVDKYGDYQVKIVWSTNTTRGPDNTNWAKDLTGLGWTSANQYHYLLNPQNSSGVSQAAFTMYTNSNAGSLGYQYCVIVQVIKDGMTERMARYDYYSYEYNRAKSDFDKWASLYEKYISFDERI